MAGKLEGYSYRRALDGGRVDGPAGPGTDRI
jgi:hypothetical protein